MNLEKPDRNKTLKAGYVEDKGVMEAKVMKLRTETVGYKVLRRK